MELDLVWHQMIIDELTYKVIMDSLKGHTGGSRPWHARRSSPMEKAVFDGRVAKWHELQAKLWPSTKARTSKRPRQANNAASASRVVRPRDSGEDDVLKIQVKTLTGQHYEVTGLTYDSTNLDLMTAIEDFDGTPINQMTLIVNGHRLVPSETIPREVFYTSVGSLTTSVHLLLNLTGC